MCYGKYVTHFDTGEIFCDVAMGFDFLFSENIRYNFCWASTVIDFAQKGCSRTFVEQVVFGQNLFYVLAGIFNQLIVLVCDMTYVVSL